MKITTMKIFFSLTDCQVQQLVPVGNNALHRIHHDIKSGVHSDHTQTYCTSRQLIYLSSWGLQVVRSPILCFWDPFNSELMELSSFTLQVHLSPVNEKATDLPSTFQFKILWQMAVCITCSRWKFWEKKTKILLFIKGNICIKR